MCNLYSMTTTTEAIQRLVAEWEDAMRNVPPLYAIYPDYTAPLVKQRGDQRVLGFARWGLPSLQDSVTEKPNRGNTYIRHPWFDDWKRVSRGGAPLPGPAQPLCGTHQA